MAVSAELVPLRRRALGRDARATLKGARNTRSCYNRQPVRGALGVILTIVLADMMGFGLIIPLLPFYAKNFNASDFQVGLIFSIYSACQMIGSPVLGMLSDRFGRRPVLVLSLLGSVSGYLILAAATYFTWASPLHGLILVYLSRVIDGFTGGNVSTAQAYIADVTPPDQRARAMGLMGAAFGIGFSIGPGVGGLLGYYHPSWPAVAAAALCLFAATMTLFRLRESRHHEPSEEGELWLHPSRFAPVLRNGPLVQMMMIAFFSMIAFVMLEAVFALFLKDTFGYGPREVGWFFAFVGATIIIVQGFLIGRLTRRFGEWSIVITGPLLVTGAMAIYVEAGLRPMVWLVIVAGLFNATGRSLQMPSLNSLISKHSDRTMHGRVFGLHHMLGSLARVIGPVIATGVYTLHHTTPFVVAGAVTLSVAVWTIYLRAREPGERGFEVAALTPSPLLRGEGGGEG